ncbi:hypothetical protein [Kribbella sp. DT2]|uniref:hypothetical protein n=1 Tax=Kribbella sp. DT2 TaxID=3393427 RepID=UPI003CF9C476
MGELGRARVGAANDAWAGQAPLGAEVVETPEYRLVRMPERYGSHLMVQWVRSSRPADAVLADIATRALSQGMINTSSPILQRLGFVAYGQEHAYRLPLTG